MGYGEYKGKQYDGRHGGPFDRGSADAYYGRSATPHCYSEETANSTLILEYQMTPEDLEAYYAGYESTPFGLKDYG